ncbi:hypothetical protein B0H13DRAFT_2322396 [Mycena leptocephala]|nr:hypothetical protein B0H13DRAFT_2322396 [Mycena leptocephala]
MRARVRSSHPQYKAHRRAGIPSIRSGCFSSLTHLADIVSLRTKFRRERSASPVSNTRSASRLYGSKLSDCSPSCTLPSFFHFASRRWRHLCSLLARARGNTTPTDRRAALEPYSTVPPPLALQPSTTSSHM